MLEPGGEIQKIIKTIKKHGLTVIHIFNTHYHADHTGGNKKLKILTNAKILIHKNDVAFLLQRFDEVKILTLKLSISPVPDLIIDKDTTIKIGSYEFQIIHTPGHTPGGICFYNEKRLFTGDTLFVGDSGATKFKGGDRAAMGDSIRRIMKMFPDDTVIYPGHDYGPTLTSTLHWEKRNNVNAMEYKFYVEDPNDYNG